MRPKGKSFSGDVCGCGSVHTSAYLYVQCGRAGRLQMKLIYTLNIPLFIRELQHHFVPLTAPACNWQTELKVSGLDQ